MEKKGKEAQAAPRPEQEAKGGGAPGRNDTSTASSVPRSSVLPVKKRKVQEAQVQTEQGPMEGKGKEARAAPRPEQVAKGGGAPGRDDTSTASFVPRSSVLPVKKRKVQEAQVETEQGPTEEKGKAEPRPEEDEKGGGAPGRDDTSTVSSVPRSGPMREEEEEGGGGGAMQEIGVRKAEADPPEQQPENSGSNVAAAGRHDEIVDNERSRNVAASDGSAPAPGSTGGAVSSSTGASISAAGPGTAASVAPIAPAAQLPPARKPHYRKELAQVRQEIHDLLPEQPQFLGHDSTFMQIAVAIQNMRGTAEDLTDLAGADALRQVLPPGTNFGRGKLGLYRAARDFIVSYQQQHPPQPPQQ